MGIFRFFLPGLKENWKVVTLSILGATTFWFFNAMNKSYETRVDYPLTFVFDKDSVVVMKPLATTINVNLTSGGWNLMRRTMRVYAKPIQIHLDNPTVIKYYTRASLIPLMSDQLGHDGLKLGYVFTDTLFVDIEAKVTKKLPFLIDSLAIPLARGYRLVGPIEQGNDSVTVSGPESIMKRVTKQIRARFRDTEIDGNFNDELGYELEKKMNVSPKETTVKFKVSRFLAKEISIPLEQLNFPEDSSSFISQTEVLLYYTIKEDDEDDVNASDFSVVADFSLFQASDSTVTPLLMYAHEKALSIVLAKDKLKIESREVQ
jgi:hypothetical protein